MTTAAIGDRVFYRPAFDKRENPTEATVAAIGAYPVARALLYRQRSDPRNDERPAYVVAVRTATGRTIVVAPSDRVRLASDFR